MNKLAIIYPLGFTLVLKQLKYLEILNFVHHTLYFWVQRFNKSGYFFEILNFPHIFWKSQNFDFFFKKIIF